MIQSFQGMVPVVHKTAYVHPLASVIGHVSVGANCFIGAGAVLRGDWGKIILEKGCNVQENAVIHMFPNTTVTLHEGAHIGHGAMVHGATIGEQCMIGMNAVVLDDVQLGKETPESTTVGVRSTRCLLFDLNNEYIDQTASRVMAHDSEI